MYAIRSYYAFGCALFALENTGKEHKTNIISKDELNSFSYSSKAGQCRGCTANCSLTIIQFNDGHKFVSGNRCEKGAGQKA